MNETAVIPVRSYLSDLVKSETFGHTRETVGVISQFRIYACDVVTGCLQKQVGVQSFLCLHPRINLVQEVFELRHALQPAPSLTVHIHQFASGFQKLTAP